MSRAVLLLLRGEPAAATRMHPLVWVAVPVVAIAVSAEILGYAQTGAFGGASRIRGSSAVTLVTAALLFVLWFLRFAGHFGGPV